MTNFVQLDDRRTLAKFVVFLRWKSSVAVTARWDVRAMNYAYLGEVKWFAHWRKYCFFPSRDTVFDQGCLREISDFIEHETAAHKAARKAQRDAENLPLVQQ